MQLKKKLENRTKTEALRDEFSDNPIVKGNIEI